MIKFTVTGSTKNTDRFLKKLQSANFRSGIDSIAQRGVVALQAATPADTGLTAMSWSYEIEEKNGTIIISWLNSNVVNGVPVAALIQYGHGTGTGGWVSGRDYINPAIKPIFEELANEFWKKVTNA